jgi:hypothetical protein
MSTIDVTCPHCNRQMNFPAAAAGNQGKCGGCQQIVMIQPDPPAVPPAPPLPPPIKPEGERTGENFSMIPGLDPNASTESRHPAASKKKLIIFASAGCGGLVVLGLALCVVLFLFPLVQRTAQKAGSPAGVSYIPPDCVGGVRLRVQDLLDLQIMKWLPVEVAEDFGKKRMGVDIHDIVEVIGLMSAPKVRSDEQYSGQSYVRYEDPDGGGIVRFSTSYELEDLFQWSEFQTQEVTMKDGGDALLISDGGLDVLFTMPDSRTLLIGTEGMVRKMIENKNGRNASSFTNQFATLKDESQLALVINVEAFPPEMIEEAREEIARERLPYRVDDLVGQLFRLESGDLQIQIDSGLLVTVTARAKDHTAAVKLHESLTQALERGREMILDESDFYTGDDMLDHSLGRYASRVSKQVIDLLQFEVGGQSVVFQTELIK